MQQNFNIDQGLPSTAASHRKFQIKAPNLSRDKEI
jgi:hypothetical protein